MKKTILSILILLMMASNALAQSCGIQSDYTTTTSTYSPGMIALTLSGVAGSSTDSSLTKGTTVNLNINAVPWDSTCFNYVPGLTAFGNLEYKLASFFQDTNYYWVDTHQNADGDRFVHLFNNGAVDYTVVLTDSEQNILASGELDAATNLDANAIAICNDNRIYVVGQEANTNGHITILTQNGNSFNVVSSARYQPYDLNMLLDVECDNRADVAVIIGRGYDGVSDANYFLTTIDNDGDSLDFDYFTNSLGDNMGQSAKIDLYPRTGQDSQVFLAGLEGTGTADILIGKYTISSAGLLTMDFLQDLGYAVIDGYTRVQDLKTDEAYGKFYVSFEAQYNTNFEGGIAQISSAGTVLSESIIDVDQTTPYHEISITNQDSALITFQPDIIGEMTSGLSLWKLNPSGGDTLTIAAIQFYQYSGNYFAVSYSINGVTKYGALLKYSDKSVQASQLMSQSFTITQKAIRWSPGANNFLTFISNDGAGFQSYGITSPIGGPVPEFSLTTLLLATLLAGGLVLFVIRKRK